MKTYISFLFALISQIGLAQITGSGAYIKGNFVEIGIDGLGGFEGADTATAPMPVGMHFRSATPYLGFTANPQMNGWATYDGDFFTPGLPENTWGIQIIDNAGTVNLKAYNGRMYPLYSIQALKMPGAITGYSHSGGIQTVTWETDFDTLAYAFHFTLVYTLYDTALTYNTTFTVSNVGEDIDEFYFFKNIDLDNNYSLTGDYITTNTVVSQPSGTSDLAEAKSEQFSPWHSGFSLSAHDSTARVIYGGFHNWIAKYIWDCAGPIDLEATPGSSSTKDSAIAIACKMDSLFAFRSLRSFTFTSSFLGGAVTGTPEGFTNGHGIYPNPVHDVFYIRQAGKVNQVTIYNTMGTVLYQTENSMHIDVSSLSSGLYIVLLETADGPFMHRMIKQ